MRYLISSLGLALGIITYLLDMREVGMAVLVIIGLLHTLMFKPGNFCTNRWSSCEIVLSSPYARPLGIPLEWLGASWFLGAPIFYYIGLGYIWALIGVVGIAVLIAIEAKLKTLCTYCTLAHLLGITLAVFLWLG